MRPSPHHRRRQESEPHRLEVINYKGAKTTLCAGCGHNSISERVIECFYEMGVEPWRVGKFSGIGCSSKSPAYFLNLSHGFNAVHGRMPSIATGAIMANRTMLGLGVTGDGDTASIGIGQFMHLVRRNLPMIYIIEDNGVYGLTKGQFSATADLGSKLKTGVINDLPPFDCCALALQVGRDFRGPLFSRRQEAVAGDDQDRHRAQRPFRDRRDFAVRDFQRSRRLHQELQLYEGARRDAAGWILRAVLRRDFRGDRRGRSARRQLHDGSHLRIRKLNRDYDPTSRLAAFTALEEAERKHEVLTGVLYVNTEKPNFLEMLHLAEEPLATLPQAKVRPGREALDEIMEELRF
jgi:2-oxoglutarate ferredoxin oxidoreductase subunit beta